MTANTTELNQNELAEVNGGALVLWGGSGCSHSKKVKTGCEREDSRFFFWSQHQFECYCPDCENTVWIDEEP